MRLCFTTNLGRGQQIQSIRRDASSVSGLSSFLKKSVPSVSFPLGGDAILDVDGAVRESACEAMFEQDEDRLSVSTAVLDALLASPVDTRRPLARYTEQNKLEFPTPRDMKACERERIFPRQLESGKLVIRPCV